MSRKPLEWVGSARRDLRALPAEVKDVFGFALFEAQCGGKHIDAKPLKGFGGSVLEVVSDSMGSTFRAVYTVKLRYAVYVLHVFQKKAVRGIATPKIEVEKIRSRLRLAIEHHKEKYEKGVKED